MDSFINELAGPVIDSSTSIGARSFHERMPAYAPSELRELPSVAEELGISEFWLKDESSRMGLPSFKILGASWATFRAIEQQAEGVLGEWETVDELSEKVRSETKIRRLATATDGNHGRAVARMARWLGLAATVFVPTGTTEARIEAIMAEGATVEIIDGSYLAAVERAAEEGGEDCLVISDTSWEGYEDVPRWVSDGYSTIFEEATQQLSSARRAEPTVVVVQIGVGALAAGVVRNYRGDQSESISVLGVEPESAACAIKSMRSGSLETVPGPHPSIMAGLNCDTPSVVAWPEVSRGIDVFVSIDDDAARQGMRRLAAEGIVSGETGAAGFAGIVELSKDQSLRDALGLDAESRVLVLSTEGATDPGTYASIVGTTTAANLGIGNEEENDD